MLSRERVGTWIESGPVQRFIILIATFTMLNLFIGIIVETMQTMHEADHAAERRGIEGAMHDDTDRVLSELKRLQGEIAALRAQLGDSAEGAAAAAESPGPGRPGAADER